MSKITKLLVVLFCVVLMSFVFTGCDTSEEIPATPSSEGLAFELNEDGQSYTCTGIGTCTDTEIAIGTYNDLPVTNIGGNAFLKCEQITGITIGAEVKFIEFAAFMECANLSQIRLVGDDIDISYNSFKKTAYFENSANWENGILYIDQYLIATKSEEISGNITVKDGTKNIIACAFRDCCQMTSISLPDSIIKLGWGAFYGCTSMTSFTFPPNVDRISGGLFAGCTALTNMTIPNSIVRIEDREMKAGSVTIRAGAFENCTSLTSITIPDSVTYIGSNAFAGCVALTNITIPDSVEGLGESAFAGCTGLTSIKLSKKIQTIEKNTFLDCVALTDIEIPNSVTTIGGKELSAGLHNGGAFQGCTSLTSIIIPDSVTVIEGCAFVECTGLNSITLPDTLTSLGPWAFENTAYYNDESNWENGVLYIGKHLIDNDGSLTGEYIIKEGTLTIGGCAFRGCSELTNVILPNSIKNIGENAFSRIRFTDIYFTGTEAEWNAIEGLADADISSSATIHYNYTP